MFALAVIAPVADVVLGVLAGYPLPAFQVLTLVVVGVVRRRAQRAQQNAPHCARAAAVRA